MCHLKEKKELLQIQDEYLKMKEKIFIDDLNDNLLDTVLEFAEKGGYCARSLSDEKKFDYEEFPEEVHLNVKSISFRSFDAYLSRMKEIAEYERLNPPNTESIPHSENYVPSSKNFAGSFIQDDSLRKSFQNLFVSVPPLNFDVCVDKLHEGFEKRIKEMQNFAESKKKTQEEKLFKWLSIWKFNVRKVKKLYTVKYDEKPKEDDKSSRSRKLFY